MPKSAHSRDWKLEDAKARFSELVRRARDEGPQAVTVRGRRAVVVVDAEDFERLAAPKPETPLVTFLEGLSLEGLDLTREPDNGREVEI
ncbi:MAG: type II toxin-antitoxin system prevent-host-death family antitoxin [Caulobacteraceae bacterium]